MSRFQRRAIGERRRGVGVEYSPLDASSFQDRDPLRGQLPVDLGLDGSNRYDAIEVHRRSCPDTADKHLSIIVIH